MKVVGFDDEDDPIIWECSSGLRPGGHFRYSFCRVSDRDRLVAAFGEEWFRQYLIDKEAEIKNFRVM